MPFISVEEAIETVRRGEMLIVVDDEDRENEGDLTMAAELARPEEVAFIRKYASGVICVPMTTERLQELDLPQMVSRNEARLGTAFTVSVDAREGVTTGISAADRARTINVLGDPNTKTHDLVNQGTSSRSKRATAACSCARARPRRPWISAVSRGSPRSA